MGTFKKERAKATPRPAINYSQEKPSALAEFLLHPELLPRRPPPMPKKHEGPQR